MASDEAIKDSLYLQLQQAQAETLEARRETAALAGAIRKLRASVERAYEDNGGSRSALNDLEQLERLLADLSPEAQKIRAQVQAAEGMQITLDTIRSQGDIEGLEVVIDAALAKWEEAGGAPTETT